MVTEVEEVRQARALLAEAHEQLAGAGVAHAWPIETGIMVEVPAAALIARALASEVDFFSIGTNDLTQYTLAAERNHPQLAMFADALHPAVLRLVAHVVRAAERQGKWVGVCGEAAADPLAATVFIGLGVRELSVTPTALAATRQRIAETDFKTARALARRALAVGSAPEVRALLAGRPE
jgi:phosphoenolpyruvate-protein kinase (PTS system EI component)